jgi:hypothetical protein
MLFYQFLCRIKLRKTCLLFYCTVCGWKNGRWVNIGSEGSGTTVHRCHIRKFPTTGAGTTTPGMRWDGCRLLYRGYFPHGWWEIFPRWRGEGYQASAPLHSLSSPALLSSVHLLGTVAKSRQEI